MMSLIKIGLLVVVIIFAFKVGQASAQSPEEVAKLRTRHSETVQTDGSLTTTFGRNLHFARNGQFRDIDLTLRQSSGSRLSPGVHILQPGDEYRMDSALVNIIVDHSSLAIINAESKKGLEWALPGAARIEPEAQIQRDRQKIASVDRGVVWEFFIGPAGVKVTGTVVAPLGNRTHILDYRLVGSQQPLELRGNNIIGDGLIIQPVIIIDALGNRYTADYSLSPSQISFAFDDSVVPLGGYPYVIDPTTNFDVAGSDDDAQAMKEGTTYPPDGLTDTNFTSTTTTLSVTKSQTATPTFLNRAAFIAWDTSSLPDDAIITDVDLILDVTTITDTNNRALLVDWFQDQPPFSLSDHTDTGTGTAGEFILGDLSTGSQTLELSITGNTISLQGWTAVRLTLSGDGPASAGDVNQIQFDSFDDAGTDEPRLAVTYTSPLAQTNPVLNVIAQLTAFEHVRESGDFLIIVPYDIQLGSGGLPSELARDEYQFIFREGTTFHQVVVPVSTSENTLLGYAEGFTAFYFTEQQVDDLGLVFNSTGTYTIELDAINGSQNTTSTDIRYRSGGVDDLEAELLALAQVLESNWNLDLVSAGQLTATGQDYFESVIPFLEEMVPGILNTVETRNNPARVTHDTTASDAHADFWSGTTAADGFTTLGNQWGMSSLDVRTAITLIIVIMVAVIMLLRDAPAWSTLMVGGVIICLAPTIGMAHTALALIIGLVGFFSGTFAWWISRG